MGNIHKYSVKLYRNNLTTDSNLYYARPAADRTLSIEEVAQSAVEKVGVTTTYSQMVTAVKEWMAEAHSEMMDGFSVNTGYDIRSLTMEGNFDGPDDTYDATRHKLKINITPTETATDELENVIVNVVGVADVEPSIKRVVDMSNGNINTTLTRSKAFRIVGERLKVSGDDASCGVYLTNADDGSTVQITGNEILRNEPSQLWVMVPDDLPDGQYTVSVTTQFCNSSYNRKEPRTASYATELTVA